MRRRTYDDEVEGGWHWLRRGGPASCVHIQQNSPQNLYPQGLSPEEIEIPEYPSEIYTVYTKRFASTHIHVISVSVTELGGGGGEGFLMTNEDAAPPAQALGLAGFPPVGTIFLIPGVLRKHFLRSVVGG